MLLSFVSCQFCNWENNNKIAHELTYLQVCQPPFAISELNAQQIQHGLQPRVFEMVEKNGINIDASIQNLSCFKFSIIPTLADQLPKYSFKIKQIEKSIHKSLTSISIFVLNFL